MPKFLRKYLPKISVFGAAYPNFSFRQLPSASVDKGKPSPHILLGLRQQCLRDGGAEAGPVNTHVWGLYPYVMWRLAHTGARCFLHRSPFAMCRIIYVFGISHPYATRRKLPLASVGSHGPPSPHILLSFRLRGTWDGVRGPKLLNQYLRKIQGFSAALSNFSIRQLPSAPAGFRGLPSPHILSEFRKTK